MNIRGACRTLLCVAVTFAVSAASVSAAPGGVSVSPLRLQLDSERTSGALTVTNTSDRAYRYQVEVMRWTQHGDGEDVYMPAAELLANPPLLTVPPGGARVIRVGLLAAAPEHVEAAFRIYLTEVPVQQPVQSTGLQILLRMGIPLYVAPVQEPRRMLLWSARLDGAQIRVTAMNRGDRHERRAQLRIHDHDRGALVFSTDGFRDLLAGSTAHWTVPLQGPAPQSLKIEANTHEGHESVVVRVDRP